MANEATIRASLQIRKGNLTYQSQPSSFTANMGTAKGPAPGAITIPIAGVEINVSEFTTPGLCRLMNLDEDNFVEYGIFDTEADVFFPLGELLPGETYILRFSRNLKEEYAGTGTGTSAPTNKLWFKANTAPCVVLVEIFEV